MDVVPVAVAVELDRSGRLKELGRYEADAPVLRVLPVGHRLAAVTGSSVVLLDPADLRPRGALVLDPAYEDPYDVRPPSPPRPPGPPGPRPD